MSNLALIVIIALILAVLWLLWEIRKINKHFERRGNLPPAEAVPQKTPREEARDAMADHEARFHRR